MEKRIAGCMDRCRWHSDMLHISETKPSPLDHVCMPREMAEGSCNHFMGHEVRGKSGWKLTV